LDTIYGGIEGLRDWGIEELRNWGIEGLKDKIHKIKEIEFLQFLNS
jgi:hypothetical protein